MKFSRLLLNAVFVIPLTEKGNFQTLSYDSIPKHEIVFSKSGMKVKVNKSAMPLIYPLSKTKNITSVKIKGHVSDLIHLKEGIIQGSDDSEKYIDDYTLRLGLVLNGERTLNWLQKKMASDWVLQLYKLAPKGKGIDKIQFYNLTQQKSQLGKKTIHPLGRKLMHEENLWHIDKVGDFEIELKLKSPKPTHAFWIATDGDGSGSSFEITINEFSYITENQKTR